MTDEQRVKRIHHHMYETCEGIAEHAERIVALEEENAKLRELIRHMYECIERIDRTDEDGGCILCPYQKVEYDCVFKQRMLELGIEVNA